MLILFTDPTFSLHKDVMRIANGIGCRVVLNPSWLHLRGIIETVESEPHLVASVSNWQMIPEAFLSLPNFNIHGAPPWYPGWGGLPRALLDKQRVHGVVAHRMEPTVDSGDIYRGLFFSISKDEDFNSLTQKMSLATVALFREMIDVYRRYGLTVQQPVLDWSQNKMNMTDVINLLRDCREDWAAEAMEHYQSLR